MIPFQLGVLKLLLAYFIVSASIEKRALQRDKKNNDSIKCLTGS